MIKTHAPILAGKRLALGATVTLWVIAIGVPAILLHTNRVQAARQDAESRLIARLAAVVQTSSTDAEELFATLERQQRELSDVRYVRVCNRLGMTMDWKSLFAQIKKRSKGEQEIAARVIAQEFELDPGTSLKTEQLRVVMNAAGLPIDRSKPIPERMRAAIN